MRLCTALGLLLPSVCLQCSAKSAGTTSIRESSLNDFQPIRCSQAYMWRKSWVDKLMTTYFAPYSGPTQSGYCSCFQTKPQRWDEPVLMEAMINYIWASGDNQWLTDIEFSSFIGHPSTDPQTFGGKNDDILWAALAWIKWYEFSSVILHQSADNYLDYAKGMINIAATNKTSTECNLMGGVFSIPGNVYRNTITNALYTFANAWYFAQMHDEYFLQQAEDTFNWLMAHGTQKFPVDSSRSAPDFGQTETYQRSDGLFYDGINDQSQSDASGDIQPGICTLNRQVWTYNQGTILAAAAYLYGNTKNTSYIDVATRILDGVINSTTNGILTEACDVDNTCDDDQQSFKGIFLMRLQYLIDKVNNANFTAKYSTFIGRQVRAIVDNALNNATGDISNVWFQKSSSPSYGPHILGMAISAANIATKYGTTDGTFEC